MKKIVKIVPLMAVVLISCHRQETESREEIMRVEVQTVDSMSSVISRTYVGKTNDADIVSLSMGAAGTIAEVYVHNGQQVRAGQALLKLDATKSESMLATAQAKLQQAQDAYDRVKMVYAEGGVSEVKMMEISTQLSEAREAVTALRSKVNDCTLRAPMSGEVSNLRVYAGQNILPDIEVLRIHNRSSKSVEYSVPEQDIVRIETGDTVMIRIPTLGDREWTGIVTERSLSPNMMAHSYSVKCMIEGEADAIMPGMTCKVYSRKDLVDGYMIPSHCVQMIGSNLCVWVCRDGTARRVRVESSSYGRDGVLISSGLERGDHVITNGYQKLYEGMKIDCHEKEE